MTKTMPDRTLLTEDGSTPINHRCRTEDIEGGTTDVNVCQLFLSTVLSSIRHRRLYHPLQIRDEL